MSVPTNKCHKCHDFMEIKKIDGEYIMFCPTCDKEKKNEGE